MVLLSKLSVVPRVLRSSVGGVKSFATRAEDLAAMASALSAAAAEQALAKETPAKLNMAIVGGGRMGEIRATHLNACTEARLSAFVDVSAAAAVDFGQRYDCEPFLDLSAAAEALAARGEALDAVWVCAPTPAHRALIAEAAALGCHVAVEKPASDGAEEMRA